MKQKVKKGAIIRLLIVFIIPFLLAFYLYPPYEKIDFAYIPNIYEKGFLLNTNEIGIKTYNSDIFKPTTKNILGDVLQIPLNLKWYDICFINTGKRKFFEKNDSDIHNTTIKLNFSNNKILEIPPEYMNCDTYEINKEFSYTMNVKSEMALKDLYELKNTVDFFNNMTYPEILFYYTTPLITATGQPNRSTLIAKYFLVYIAFFGVLWLLTRIRKFILYGWDC